MSLFYYSCTALDASRIPVALQPSSPEQSFFMATQWATQLGAASAPDGYFPLHKPFGNKVIRAVICPQLDTFDPVGSLALGVAWTPLESLWDSDLADLLVVAVERIQKPHSKCGSITINLVVW